MPVAIAGASATVVVVVLTVAELDVVKDEAREISTANKTQRKPALGSMVEPLSEKGCGYLNTNRVAVGVHRII